MPRFPDAHKRHDTNAALGVHQAREAEPGPAPEGLTICGQCDYPLFYIGIRRNGSIQQVYCARCRNKFGTPDREAEIEIHEVFDDGRVEPPFVIEDNPTGGGEDMPLPPAGAVDPELVPLEYLPDPARRLRRVRIERGYRSMENAARAMSLPIFTYRQHENGKRALSVQAAMRYAEFFEVSAHWLLTGEITGHPF